MADEGTELTQVWLCWKLHRWSEEPRKVCVGKDGQRTTNHERCGWFPRV